MDPVIVVGAGPVGLALALALARHEVRCVVLDEAPAGSGDVRPARTAVLSPETAGFLDRLGCRDTLEAAGTRWAAWRTVHRRRLVERVEFDGEQPSPLHVPQHALVHALRAALAREYLVRVVPGSRLDALEQDEHGVRAHTRGADARWWQGSYLVGCDGPRSTVRKLLEIRFPGRTAVERHAVAALRTELPWPGEALAHRAAPRYGGGGAGRMDGGGRIGAGRMGGAGGEVSARPLPDGVWRLDWLLPPGRDLVTPDALVARIHETLGGWAAEAGAGGAAWAVSDAGEAAGAAAGPAHARAVRDGRDERNERGQRGVGDERNVRDGRAVRDGRGEPEGRGEPDVPAYELLDTGVHTVHHRLARRWRRGRAFLAGDAAHLLGALGTQGLEEGLRDAENLAWKLGLAWHHGASEVLLDSYQTERRSAVATRLRAADQALALLRGGERGRWRAVLPGVARGHTALLTDGHLGRGSLGAPPTYTRTPLAPDADALPGEIPLETVPGAPVLDVPVTAPDGTVVGLRERLGRGLLVVLVAPGTGVWERRHWLSAGLMPLLSDAVSALPMAAEVLVAEEYPGAAAHTVLVVRPDGYLVAALAGVRPDELTACAEAVRGGSAERTVTSGRVAGEADGARRTHAPAADTPGNSPLSKEDSDDKPTDGPGAAETEISEDRSGHPAVDPA
ncbi:FAD-dependent monooxygenase [Streptomyces sp. MST-110588]|uniref:FAD-dependent monooxygenase n=1 Tax=Streptomyces sp. MST-110588 TaxID=2833628 RepID=UPI001F5D3FC7|nr:FAD-dependent monooxygenase [Streptomyces sp. MST-110588]UNO39607.1 FAD-dependent monooxygenase [Streptomyces sp. MST-110588]